MSHIMSNKKIKLLWIKKNQIIAQENNWVCLLEEMTNASALSEKKPSLIEQATVNYPESISFLHVQ